MGILVAIFGGFFVRELLTVLGTPRDIFDNAVAYSRVMLVATPCLFAFLLFTSMMRGVGDTMTPLFALLISTAIGLLVTPALIRGWFGLPTLGVASGAWASVISFAVTLAWLTIYLRRKDHALAPDAALLGSMGVDLGILRLILKIGVPAGIQMVTISLSEVVLLALVNRYGSDATAAYGAVNQIMSYVQFRPSRSRSPRRS